MLAAACGGTTDKCTSLCSYTGARGGGRERGTSVSGMCSYARTTLDHRSNSACSSGAAGTRRILILAGAENDGVPQAEKVGAASMAAARH